MRYPLFRDLEQLATDRWARQGVRTLIRAAWIGACIWCIGLGGHLLWGWPLRLEILGALALAVIGAAVLLLLRPKLSPQEAARRLDRRFLLDEQLATAVEVAATNPPPESIAARLLAYSGQTTAELRRGIARRQRPPWNEVITLAALLLAVAGMYILVGIDRPALDTTAALLPPLASAQDPSQQFPQEPPQQSEQQQALVPGQDGQAATGNAAGQPTGAGDPAALEALADALRDQGATRAAAEALDRGDIAGAAQELRQLADQAGQLSQSARGDLADRLQEAAKRIGPSNQALADQLRENASDLRRGGEDAAKALDDLAREIEQQGNGQSPSNQPGQSAQSRQDQQGQGDQSGQGQQGQQGEGDQQGQGGGSGAGTGNGQAGEQHQANPQRLGVEGQPVPLESSGPGQVPAEPSDRPPTSSEPVPGFTRGDASSGERVQTGADPLRVPLDERDVVQEYFTP